MTHEENGKVSFSPSKKILWLVEKQFVSIEFKTVAYSSKFSIL